MAIPCTYEQEYWNYESQENHLFECEIESVENKNFCLFHDETYLKDSNHPENKDNVITKLSEKVDNSISKNTSLLCIGYYLPDIKIDKEFSKPVYFNNCKFQYSDFSGTAFSGIANFSRATFKEANFSWTAFFGIANFSRAKFSAEANFSSAAFSDKDILDFSRVAFSGRTYFSEIFRGTTYFNYVLFENPNQIIFDENDMSNVSFMDTDIAKIKFPLDTVWGKNDKFKIIEEEWLEGDDVEKKNRITIIRILSIYRNLRENYEFRLRYDEAGRFFIREMEIEKV